MSTIWGSDHIKSRHIVYCGIDCMKKFCASLRERAKNIIDLEKKKNVTVNKRRIEIISGCNGMLYLCKRMLKFTKDKTYRQVRDHCHYTGKYRGAAHSSCNLKFNVPNEIPGVFHSGSSYDYHSVIKELENEFGGKLECLKEDTEKHKTFSVPIENQMTKIYKDGNESVETIAYKIKFIDSARFIGSSLKNPVDNLAKGIHKIKCKYCDCFLEYEIVKDDLIKCKYLYCNEDYLSNLDEALKKKNSRTHLGFLTMMSMNLFCC